MSRFEKRVWKRKLTREKLEELLGKTFVDKKEAIKQVDELLEDKEESEVKSSDET